MNSAATTEHLWTVTDGEAREVVLLATESNLVHHRVRALDTGAEWVTLTGLYDTRFEALVSNGLA